MQIYNTISQGILGKYDENYADYANFSQSNEISSTVAQNGTIPSTSTTKVSTKIVTKGGKLQTAKSGKHYSLKYECTATNKSPNGGQIGYIQLIGNGKKLPWTSKTMTNDAYSCAFQVTDVQNTSKLDEVASSIFKHL